MDDGRAVPLDGVANFSRSLIVVAQLLFAGSRSEPSSLPGRASATARFFPRHLGERVRDIAAPNPSKAMVRRARLDREENAVPGRAERSARDERQGEVVRPRAIHCAVVLGAIKAEPSVAAEEAASLDSACARRRQHLAVGARESLRRGRTRETTWKQEKGARRTRLRLHLPLRLENGRMGSAGAEQKDGAEEKKEHEKEDAMTSDAVA